MRRRSASNLEVSPANPDSPLSQLSKVWTTATTLRTRRSSTRSLDSSNTIGPRLTRWPRKHISMTSSRRSGELTLATMSRQIATTAPRQDLRIPASIRQQLQMSRLHYRQSRRRKSKSLQYHPLRRLLRRLCLASTIPLLHHLCRQCLDFLALHRHPHRRCLYRSEVDRPHRLLHPCPALLMALHLHLPHQGLALACRDSQMVHHLPHRLLRQV